MKSRSRVQSEPRTEPVEHVFPPWGVDVFESHHADGWRMDRTTHDFLKVVFVLQGRGAFVTPEGRTACEAGQAIVVRAGVAHQLEDAAGAPMSLYVVSVERPVLEAACLEQSILPGGVIDLAPAEAMRVERGMRRLLFEQTLEQPTTGPSMVGQVLHLLVEFARIEMTAPRATAAPRVKRPSARSGDSGARMDAYVTDLAQHFFEATNLDAAATNLGLSRRRFTQLFREATGTSWLAYVRRLRIDHARRLLRTTDRTVLSVAFECGFDDLSTFYRAFKRETGVSPNHWRESPPKSEG